MSKFVVGFVAAVCVMAVSAFAQNKVVFDNQSGEPALVKQAGTVARADNRNGPMAGKCEGRILATDGQTDSGARVEVSISDVGMAMTLSDKEGDVLYSLLGLKYTSEPDGKLRIRSDDATGQIVVTATITSNKKGLMDLDFVGGRMGGNTLKPFRSSLSCKQTSAVPPASLRTPKSTVSTPLANETLRADVSEQAKKAFAAGQKCFLWADPTARAVIETNSFMAQVTGDGRIVKVEGIHAIAKPDADGTVCAILLTITAKGANGVVGEHSFYVKEPANTIVAAGSNVKLLLPLAVKEAVVGKGSIEISLCEEPKKSKTDVPSNKDSFDFEKTDKRKVNAVSNKVTIECDFGAVPGK
jgi:hypothetical protein